ncbi:MAG TPA: sterol desaturase family protein [Candidatus Acidoferrum sp.]|nr:sterol desaturase family protein [Candidatus Acidoferrum sp.]
MPTASEVREIACEHGRAKKRNNAIVALLSGALPGIVLSFYLPVSWERWLIGLVIGLVWGNAFEYAYHRWMLHRRRSSFAKGHLEHHGTIGAPEEAEHVTLGRSPFHIALLFASNGVFVIVLDLLLGLGLMPGIFVGWTVYLIAAEEIHWRIHMEGWLPPGLGFARAYHMSHHDIPNTRYNVFLPLCDFLLGNSRLPRASHGLKQSG